MEATAHEILYYMTSEGKIPFLEWLYSLKDKTVRAKIRIRLDWMVEGNFGDHRSVGDGIIELRVHYGSGYRVYFAREGGRIVVIMCGGDKSTQGKDIKLAKKYWEDYKREEF